MILHCKNEIWSQGIWMILRDPSEFAWCDEFAFLGLIAESYSRRGCSFEDRDDFPVRSSSSIPLRRDKLPKFSQFTLNSEFLFEFPVGGKIVALSARDMPANRGSPSAWVESSVSRSLLSEDLAC